MALSTGEKVGPYLITGLLGKGGMGEVYRARDPRLERDIAIKVLPAALAQNQERLARFEREAKVLAALNHPNIATIYGLEELPGSTRAIVMELVEGPTLADRLSNGVLPKEVALPIAQQIVAALEAAHEKGVVHRDLKPANIKAPADTSASVKVLDFGLATALQTSSSEPRDGRGESPTLTMAATEAGVILGTAGYMSPEQAAGKNVDKRADIWAFGVVLWEMLTGERLFADGESISHVLADVLRAPIPFEKIPAGPLRELLRRCLDRDVKTRLRDIGEARVALARVVSGAESPTQASPEGKDLLHKMQWAGWAAAAIATAAAIPLWLPWRAEPEKPLMRLEVDLGEDVSLPSIGGSGPSVIISPDGTRLAYRTFLAGGRGGVQGGSGGGRGRLGPWFIRRLNENKAVELSGTESANPHFSPDGQWIAFTISRGGGTNKMPAEGGPVVPVGQGALSDWAEDGTMLLLEPGGLQRIPAGGGPPVKVTEASSAFQSSQIQLLPGGRAGLFASGSGRSSRNDTAVQALTFTDGKTKTLVPGAGSPHYVPTGHLLYVSKGTLFAVAFDPEKLETRGNPAAIVNDVQHTEIGEIADISISRTGVLVYRKGGVTRTTFGTAQMKMEWIDAAGRRSPVTAKTGPYSRPGFSPDGSQVALLITEPDGRDEWVYDLRLDSFIRVTFGEPPFISTPAWSPDGRYLFVGSGNGDVSGIYLVRADGSTQHPERLVQTQSVVFPGSYSKEAKRLTFYGLLEATSLFTAPLAEERGQWKAGKPEPFLPPSQSRNRTPAFSPDGRWLAYATDESGQSEVNVRPVSGLSRKWKISSAGGANPRWWHNELLYEAGDRIMSVNYKVTGETFTYEKPRVRVDKLGSSEWDIAPDGRILVLTRIETNPDTPPPAEHTVVFLLNFFDELRRRAPVK